MASSATLPLFVATMMGLIGTIELSDETMERGITQEEARAIGIWAKIGNWPNVECQSHGDCEMKEATLVSIATKTSIDGWEFDGVEVESSCGYVSIEQERHTSVMATEVWWSITGVCDFPTAAIVRFRIGENVMDYRVILQ